MLIELAIGLPLLYAPTPENRRYNTAMRHALKRHPDSICTAIAQIDVQVTRPTAGSLALHYVMTGNIAKLQLPATQSAFRADELWQHTCCEAFIEIPGSTAYFEMNFSPSTQWAAYRFDAYRHGMTIAEEFSSPRIAVRVDNDRFELRASIDCTDLSVSMSNATLRLGLAAVIEERSGRKSYWALAHAPGKPDFHRADHFIIELER